VADDPKPPDLKALGAKAVASAVGKAFETRERASRAQTAALGALNLPTADDVQRLTRRIRDVSQRIEHLEDGVDAADTKLERLAALERRLTAIEASLQRIEAVLMPQDPPDYLDTER
jgi:predicted  nucleic acid-binding Zn-ribbon protein